MKQNGRKCSGQKTFVTMKQKFITTEYKIITQSPSTKILIISRFQNVRKKHVSQRSLDCPFVCAYMDNNFKPIVFTVSLEIRHYPILEVLERERLPRAHIRTKKNIYIQSKTKQKTSSALITFSVLRPLLLTQNEIQFY